MKMTPRLIIIGGLAVVLTVVAFVVFLPAVVFKPAPTVTTYPYTARGAARPRAVHLQRLHVLPQPVHAPRRRDPFSAERSRAVRLRPAAPAGHDPHRSRPGQHRPEARRPVGDRPPAQAARVHAQLDHAELQLPVRAAGAGDRRLPQHARQQADRVDRPHGPGCATWAPASSRTSSRSPSRTSTRAARSTPSAA